MKKKKMNILSVSGKRNTFTIQIKKKNCVLRTDLIIVKNEYFY